MRPLASQVASSEQQEGNLRYAHMRMRQYAEEIALWKVGGGWGWGVVCIRAVCIGHAAIFSVQSYTVNSNNNM